MDSHYEPLPRLACRCPGAATAGGRRQRLNCRCLSVVPRPFAAPCSSRCTAHQHRWPHAPCSTPEDATAAANGGLGSSGGGGSAPPDDALLSSEQWQWEAIPNLDQFFTRIYR